MDLYDENPIGQRLVFIFTLSFANSEKDEDVYSGGWNENDENRHPEPYSEHEHY